MWKASGEIKGSQGTGSLCYVKTHLYQNKDGLLRADCCCMGVLYMSNPTLTVMNVFYKN